MLDNIFSHIFREMPQYCVGKEIINKEKKKNKHKN